MIIIIMIWNRLWLNTWNRQQPYQQQLKFNDKEDNDQGENQKLTICNLILKKNCLTWWKAKP